MDLSSGLCRNLNLNSVMVTSIRHFCNTAQSKTHLNSEICLKIQLSHGLQHWYEDYVKYTSFKTEQGAVFNPFFSSNLIGMINNLLLTYTQVGVTNPVAYLHWGFGSHPLLGCCTFKYLKNCNNSCIFQAISFWSVLAIIPLVKPQTIKTFYIFDSRTWISSLLHIKTFTINNWAMLTNTEILWILFQVM